MAKDEKKDAGWIVPVLGALGAPALKIFDVKGISQFPWWTILLIAGGILILKPIGGFLSNVFGHLKPEWEKQLASRIIILLSSPRKRYLKFLWYLHRDFDVKGLSTQGTYDLHLEDVYVDLTIVAKPPGQTSTDPIRVPEELRGRRQIWDYLESDALSGHLVLIGAPGSGKTTLLKKMALELASRRKGARIPVLLFLRRHGEAIRKQEDYDLPAAVEAMLARYRQRPKISAGWVESQLEAGRCLVLLDGLDEVASRAERKAVAVWLETQMKAFPRSQFVVSSRPHGYRDNPIEGVTALEVQSFTRQQVRRFVHNWYRANEICASSRDDPGVEIKAEEGAEDLLRRLGGAQPLVALSVNPLLLTMIATVHRFRSSLPGRRVELYAEICEVFLGKRQAARGQESDLTPKQKQRVLQPLAYFMMCRGLAIGRDTPGSSVLASGFVLGRARARARDLNLALAHARDLVRALTRARDLNLDLVLARALDIVLDLDLALKVDAVHDFDFDRELARVFALARDLARARNRARAHGLALDLDLAYGLSVGLAHSLTILLHWMTAPSRFRHLGGSSGVSLRREIRFMTLGVALDAESKVKESERNLFKLRGSSKKDQASLRDAALNLWADWCILERRYESNIPAIEGIRLIKEREEAPSFTP